MIFLICLLVKFWLWCWVVCMIWCVCVCWCKWMLCWLWWWLVSIIMVRVVCLMNWWGVMCLWWLIGVRWLCCLNIIMLNCVGWMCWGWMLMLFCRMIVMYRKLCGCRLMCVCLCMWLRKVNWMWLNVICCRFCVKISSVCGGRCCLCLCRWIRWVMMSNWLRLVLLFLCRYWGLCCIWCCWCDIVVVWKVVSCCCCSVVVFWCCRFCCVMWWSRCWVCVDMNVICFLLRLVSRCGSNKLCWRVGCICCVSVSSSNVRILSKGCRLCWKKFIRICCWLLSFRGMILCWYLILLLMNLSLLLVSVSGCVFMLFIFGFVLLFVCIWFSMVWKGCWLVSRFWWLVLIWWWWWCWVFLLNIVLICVVVFVNWWGRCNWKRFFCIIMNCWKIVRCCNSRLLLVRLSCMCMNVCSRCWCGCVKERVYELWRIVFYWVYWLYWLGWGWFVVGVVCIVWLVCGVGVGFWSCFVVG